MPGTWDAFYHGQVQGLWALIVVPALFLAALLAGLLPSGPGVEPRAARFVRVWALVFLVETILDPLVTGPLPAALLPFVLLGDLRVFLLVLAVATPGRPIGALVAEAAGWTLVVPLVTWVTTTILGLFVTVPSMTLWLVYEIAFTTLALALRRRLVPARVAPTRPRVRAYLRAVLAYAAAYYALWGVADALLLGMQLDAAWALRAVANQLYYALWVPFACVRFFAARYAATSTSAQTSR